MENFGDAGVFQQFDKGGKVQSLGQRIDNGSVIRSSDLNQAEFCIICFFAQELQINGDKFPVL